MKKKSLSAEECLDTLAYLKDLGYADEQEFLSLLLIYKLSNRIKKEGIVNQLLFNGRSKELKKIVREEGTSMIKFGYVKMRFDAMKSGETCLTLDELISTATLSKTEEDENLFENTNVKEKIKTEDKEMCD